MLGAAAECANCAPETHAKTRPGFIFRPWSDGTAINGIAALLAFLFSALLLCSSSSSSSSSSAS
jgi:hypothetical protein